MLPTRMIGNKRTGAHLDDTVNIFAAVDSTTPHAGLHLTYKRIVTEALMAERQQQRQEVLMAVGLNDQGEQVVSNPDVNAALDDGRDGAEADELEQVLQQVLEEAGEGEEEAAGAEVEQQQEQVVGVTATAPALGAVIPAGGQLPAGAVWQAPAPILIDLTTQPSIDSIIDLTSESEADTDNEAEGGHINAVAPAIAIDRDAPTAATPATSIQSNEEGYTSDDSAGEEGYTTDDSGGDDDASGC